MCTPSLSPLDYRLFLVIMMSPLCTFVACSPSGITLSGTVDVDGMPIEKGKISLVPKEGFDSPTAMAPVINGQFTVPPTQNLRGGEFDVRVSVTADRKPRNELTFVSNTDRKAMAASLQKALKDAPPAEESFTTDLVVDGSTDDIQLSFAR
ncbi:MAG: hypothetical protein ACF8CQ_21190 [Rhodopirellula sp. JB044]|uniref:hypothetical protein n=1 Tax=Rhodopirellula sp. JB044 TaxID=3342844 RepID=UPI00370A1FCF